MKKISVLLIAFLLVASFAFGQSVEPSVSVAGDATLTFGVDLEEGTTGFRNESSSTITLTVVPVGTATSGPEDGVSGKIELKDFRVDLSTANDTRITAGGVTAWIVVDPVEIKIFSAPTFTFDNAESWETLRETELNAVEPAALRPAWTAAVAGTPEATGEWQIVAPPAEFADIAANDIAFLIPTGGDPWVDASTVTAAGFDATDYEAGVVALTETTGAVDEEVAAYQGFTVTIPAGDLSVSLMVASLGSWAENVDNLYTTGLSVSGSLVEGITGSLGGFVGPFGGNTDSLTFGLSTELGVEIDIVSVDAAMDIAFDTDNDFTIDALLGIGLDLDVVSIGFDVYAFTTDGFEFDDNVLLRAHVDAGGLDENLDLKLTFETENTFVTDGLQFAIELDAAYDIDGIKPFATYTFFGNPEGVDSSMDLTAGVSFTGFVPLTVFTLQYAAVDLTRVTAEPTQFLTFETKVSF